MAQTVDRSHHDHLVRTVVADELTGLQNRRGLAVALYELDDPDAEYAIGVIDLDAFADINARLGHDAGNRVLQTIAENVERVVPDDAALFRPEGDEFVIILPNTTSPKALADVADAVDSAIREPIDLREGRCHVTASMGWSTTPSASPRWALTLADVAMAHAKQAGGGRSHTHSPFDPLW